MKKVLCIVLALAMALTFMVGCGGGTSTPASTPASTGGQHARQCTGDGRHHRRWRQTGLLAHVGGDRAPGHGDCRCH